MKEMCILEPGVHSSFLAPFYTNVTMHSFVANLAKDLESDPPTVGNLVGEPSSVKAFTYWLSVKSFAKIE